MLSITKFRELWTHTSTVMGVQRERIGAASVCLCAHRTSDVSHVRCWETSAAVGVMMSITSPQPSDDQPDVTDIPEMDVDHHFLDKLKVRTRIAKEIDALQHRENKAKHEKKWMRATAEALDIDLDSDYRSECVRCFSCVFFC